MTETGGGPDLACDRERKVQTMMMKKGGPTLSTAAPSLCRKFSLPLLPPAAKKEPRCNPAQLNSYRCTIFIKRTYAASIPRIPRPLRRQSFAHSVCRTRPNRRSTLPHPGRCCTSSFVPWIYSQARAATDAPPLHARLPLASSAAARCDRLCGGGKPRACDRA